MYTVPFKCEKNEKLKKIIFQYVFDVELEEDELMVSLEQWDKRIDRELGKENDTIGFFIMKASIHILLYSKHYSLFFSVQKSDCLLYYII